MVRLAMLSGAPLLAGLAAACGAVRSEHVARGEGGDGGAPSSTAGEAVAVGGEPMKSSGGERGEGGGCVIPTSGPTEVLDDVREPTTWSADASPYILLANTGVRAALTLEPCVEVLIPPEATLTVLDEGSIEGIGTEARPIFIGRAGPQAWGSLRTLGRPIKLAYATIESGRIEAQGTDPQSATLEELLHLDHVTVRFSLTSGIFLSQGAGFAAGSQELTVTENAVSPVVIEARTLGTLPTGDYTGNTRDEIDIFPGTGQQGIVEDTTIFDRGVPYHVLTSLGVGVGVGTSSLSPLLTIAPGVTIRFSEHADLSVGSAQDPRGALAAVGTEEAPITFTSASALPREGDWQGIYVWDTLDERTQLDHVLVQYAGGTSLVDSASCPYTNVTAPNAAIHFMRLAPIGQILTNSLIVDSGGHGIDRGWMGAEIDLEPSNTFQNIAECVQTLPRPEPPGVCPISPPCDAGD